MQEMTKGKSELPSADISKVLKLLPHRYPFLLVDRIIEMDRDESCIGIKNVTFNEPHFQGHFPGFPVMPGVLIIEGLAQTAGALCVHNLQEDYKPQLVYFMGIDRAKFRKPVVPGDQLELRATRERRIRTICKFSTVAQVAGEETCSAELMVMPG